MIALGVRCGSDVFWGVAEVRMLGIGWGIVAMVAMAPARADVSPCGCSGGPIVAAERDGARELTVQGALGGGTVVAGALILALRRRKQ